VTPDPRTPDHPWIADRTEAFALRDGEVVTLRPILPGDKDALQRGMALLSPESRRRRFFSSLEQLSDEQLEFFTEIDYADHFAWVAIAGDPAAVPPAGVGVARYIRDRQEPRSAEWAIAVIDEYQGRGLGTRLLQRLTDTARENGIELFVASVLADNDPMLDVVRELGGRAEFAGDGVVRVEVDLPPADDDLRSTAAYRLFRRAVRALGLRPE
jgi:RimJ/RimL family protein N-acetyltransferase